jgi:hypothetical protein
MMMVMMRKEKEGEIDEGIEEENTTYKERDRGRGE